MTKRLFSEFLATLYLVYIGTGTVAYAETFPLKDPVLVIAIAFGLAVWSGIILFGRFSGAHMNPAVSLTMYWEKKLSMQQMLSYVLAQIFGAITGSLLVILTFPKSQSIGITLPVSMEAGLIWEFGLTFLLVFAVLFLSSGKKWEKWAAPFLIGAVVGLEAYVGGPVCGASMNPARSIGPAVVLGNYHYLWIYVVAPVAGALAAFLVGRLVFVRPTE